MLPYVPSLKDLTEYVGHSGSGKTLFLISVIILLLDEKDGQ